MSTIPEECKGGAPNNASDKYDGLAFRCHFPAITGGFMSIPCARYSIGYQAHWLSKCNFYSAVIINKLHFLPFYYTFRCHL